MGRIRSPGTIIRLAISVLIAIIALSSCTFGFQQINPEDIEYEPFVPPTLVPTSLPTSTPAPQDESVESDNLSSQNNSEPVSEDSQTSECIDNLTFISDLTIEDGSIVVAGSTLDKQWEVENSGTCNWNEDYSIHLISGAPMGADTEVGLVPARSGSRVIIRIVFTAPEEPGTYHTAWQAYNPQSIAFGDLFYIDFEVE